MSCSNAVMRELVNLLTEKQLQHMSPGKILPTHTWRDLAINDWEYDMLLIDIEKKFGVAISFTESRNIKNVGDMAAILTKKVAIKKYTMKKYAMKKCETVRARLAQRQH